MAEKSNRAIRRVVVTVGLIFMLAFPMIAYAGGTIFDAPEAKAAVVVSEERLLVEADSDAPAGPSMKKAATEGTSSQDGVDRGGTRVIPESETPLSIRPYELGWALVNLLAALLSLVIGVAMAVMTMLQRQADERQVSDSFGLTVFSMAAAAFSMILFTSTEDFSAGMILVDSFTVAHIALLAVALVCGALFLRRDAGKSKNPDKMA
ncbi:MAG: hypothetical protein LBH64_02770 [Coriobacteriales bacterium]|jgi:hypothetical protein|nr:hypothetical protein [Coriobacteriales bacterium]